MNEIVKSNIDNSSYYVYCIFKRFCILFIPFIYAAVILPSCSKEQTGEKLIGSWQFIYGQSIRTYNGEHIGDVFDYYTDPHSFMLTIEYISDDVYSVTQYDWNDKTSIWEDQWEDGPYILKKVKGNNYALIKDTHSNESVELLLSEHNTVLTFIVRSWMDDYIFFNNRDYSAKPMTQDKIDDYLRQGGILYNGIEESAVYKRLTAVQ